jgi:hypothetical protein
VPIGDGAEAFVDAEDIAAVAAATLASPEAHAGAQYAPIGPEALTVSDAADRGGNLEPCADVHRSSESQLERGRSASLLMPARMS